MSRRSSSFAKDSNWSRRCTTRATGTRGNWNYDQYFDQLFCTRSVALMN